MKTRRQALQYAVLGTAAAAAASQARAAGKAPAVLLAYWDSSKKFTLTVADAMPPESYGFKPTPEMRSYGELMVHIGSAIPFYMSMLKPGGVPDAIRRPPKQFDKQTVKTYLAATQDFASTVLQGVTEDALDKTYSGRRGTPAVTGWDLVENALVHTAHHRGYAEVYLRLKGITPPTYSVGGF